MPPLGWRGRLRLRRHLVRLASAALALWGIPGTIAAQSASIGASAEISTTALTISQIADLNFGTIVPGTPTTIDPMTSSAAGEWNIFGNRNAEVSATLALPTVLRAGSGPLTLPISFGPMSACYRNKDQQNKCTPYDPNAPLVTRIRNKNPPQNDLFIWIGGTVSPSPTQAPAVYTGTITLSVVYTGN